VVPEIQLMMRVERDAETQRHPTWEDKGDVAIYELMRPSTQVKRLKHLVSRFAVGNPTMSTQNREVLQCNCAK